MNAVIGSHPNSRIRADLGIFILVRNIIFAARYCQLSRAFLEEDDNDIHTAHACVSDALPIFVLGSTSDFLTYFAGRY